MGNNAQENENNVFDQHLLEFALQQKGIETQRRTFRELHHQLSTGANNRLILDGVGPLDTVYLRAGYTRFEWMHQKLNGEPVPAEITLVRIQRGKSWIVAGYTRDLRELRSSAASLKRLETLAFTDKLTGVANRHHFLEHATATLANLNVGGSACLLILDIDHFKRVNDTYGHSGGDAILQGLTVRIQEILRPYDLFARYGGEEFVILLGRANLEAALALAERVREAIARTTFEYQGNAIRITISIGISDCCYPAPALQDMVDRADAALYQAKHDGRNRVEYSPHT